MYKSFSEADFENTSNLIDILFASFSIPGYFEPVSAFGTEFFDGSAIWDIDITSVINKCLAKGYSQEDVVIDVIMVNNDTLDFVDTSEYNSVEIIFRYLKISRYYSVFDGLNRAKFAFPDVDFRYIIGPSSKLPSSLLQVPLDLNSDQMVEMFNLGQQDALSAIE